MNYFVLATFASTSSSVVSAPPFSLLSGHVRAVQGGTPVAVVEGVPGWQTKVVQGPRRWLGLRPGRALPIADAGPWWTPSGSEPSSGAILQAASHTNDAVTKSLACRMSTLCMRGARDVRAVLMGLCGYVQVFCTCCRMSPQPFGWLLCSGSGTKESR